MVLVIVAPPEQRASLKIDYLVDSMNKPSLSRS